ncbi:MAG: hypothetical protein ACKVPY_03570 [Paracoccaceae bacterium]
MTWIPVACLALAGPAAAGGYGTPGGAGAMAGMKAQDRNMSGHHRPRMTTTGGMSLYTFDKDIEGQSNCYDKCAREWPPMMASAQAATTGDFSVIARRDGTHQWAWKGKPLYKFDEDKIAGDTKGGGYSPYWHIARGV